MIPRPRPSIASGLLKHPLSSSRSTAPPLRCAHAVTSSRAAHSASSASAQRIPAPTPFVPDVATFLKLIGRDCKQYESKIASWETLFGSSPAQLRQLGIDPPRTRRYLLRWREKFRRGDFGMWGSLAHVAEGLAELRVVDREGRKVVVNTPLSTIGREQVAEEATAEGKTDIEKAAETASMAGRTNAPNVLPLEVPSDAVLARDARVVFPGVVSGPHALPVKGTHGTVARIQVQEGLWEAKRGRKVGGGERLVRRAKTLVARRRRGVNAA